MLVSLYLKNFRKHEELSITFKDGVNGIFGKNYQGKSAILLAIAVAIGGPGWARGYTLVRRGADNFEVQLALELAGQTYRIQRTKSGAKLHRGEKLIASQQTQVNIELGKLLGMPVDRWLDLRFVRQKQAARMFESGSTKLNLLVEELTGVNTVTQVIAQLVSRAKADEAKAEGMRAALLPDDAVARISDALDTHRKEIDQAEQKVAEAKARALGLDNIDEELRVNAKALSSLREEERAAERKQHLLESLAATQDSFKVDTDWENATPSDIEENIQEWQGSLQEWEGWRRSALHGVDLRGKAEAKLAKLRGAVQKDSANLEELEQALAAAEKTKAEAGQAEADLLPRLQALRVELRDKKKLQEGGVCPTCQRTHDEFTPDKAEALQIEVTKLTDELSVSEEVFGLAKKAHMLNAENVQGLRAKLAEGRKLWEAQALHAANLKSAQAEVDAARTMVEELLAQVDAQRPETELMADVGSEIDRIHGVIRAEEGRLSSLRAYLKVKESNLKEVARLQAQLSEIGECREVGELATVRAGLEEIARTLQSRKAELGLVTQEIKGLEASINQHRKAVQEASERLQAQKELSVHVSELESKTANSKALRKYLTDNRSRYMQNAWDLILGRASTFASAVTEGWITDIRRTEDGQFLFIEDEAEAEVNEASGAQAAILGLGVQVALAETLPTSLDLIMADEPAADMDADHSASAMLTLSAVARQSVVISHHRMDESICSEVVEL